MWVELDLYGYMDDLEHIRNLLIQNEFKDFTIEASMRVMDVWPVRRAKIYLGDYTPCDAVSAKELTAKIAFFKERAEHFNQENYKLTEQLKKK